MIIKINLAANITDMLSYNQKKVEANTSENLVAKVIGTSVPLDENALMYFKHAGESNKNPNLKLRYAHIKVAVDESDNLTDYTFYKIGIDILEGLGVNRYSSPYLIYRHYDKEESNPHIHILLSRSTFGKTMPFKHYKFQSMDLSRELELKYNLTLALKKNRDKNGIKILSHDARERESKDKMQSQFQQIRDIVSDALGSSSSFMEYIQDLARHNVNTSLRIEQTPKNKFKIGLSYRLNSSSPEVKIDHTGISSDWVFINEAESIRELVDYRLTTLENRMYYLNASNQVRVNDSDYLSFEFKDFNISARKLGPGAGWFRLKNKFDSSFMGNINEQLFSPFLTDQNKLPDKRKVWKINAADIFPKETFTEQKAMLGIKESNPSYIYEAMQSGVDFLALLKKKSLQLKPHHFQKLSELATLQKHLKPNEIILADPIANQRYLRALNIDFREVKTEEGFNYAVGFIVQAVSTTAFDIQHPKEIELKINNIKQLEPKVIQKDLLTYFKEGNEEMLRIALRHPKVEFRILIPEFNYNNLKKIKLSESLVEELEVKIAQEIFRNPEQSKLQQGLLERLVRFGDQSLRFLIKVQNIDFSNINSDLESIEDPILKAAVKLRIDVDKLYLPKNTLVFQLELERAVATKDTGKIISFLEMPMLDYSKVSIQQIKNLFLPHEFERLNQRIKIDKASSANLALYREGQMEVDHKTKMIIPIRVPIDGKQYRLEKEKELDQEQANNINTNNPKDRNIGFSR